MTEETPTAPSYMEHAEEREDALPFRTFERAHRRVKLARLELEKANVELEKAYKTMQHAGYMVRGVEAGDELETRAPIPPAVFRAEEAA